MMNSTYHSFEDLKIWLEGMQLCKDIYQESKHWRDYDLRSQMRRSSVSVPSNIAEGYELHTNKAFIRHLYISKGSSGELRTQLYIAVDQRYIDETKGKELIARTKRLSGMINNFIVSRRNRVRKGER